MDHIQTIVIGAGVVGLAVARELAQHGHEVLILEAAEFIGSVTTARNSGVIHAGIYYPPGSAKAKHCVAGRHLLYRYLNERGLPYQQCGKVIVATSAAQTAKLDMIRQRAEASGVHSLTALDTAGITALEPAVQGVAGLFSPETGIVDVHEFVHALLGDAENHGAVLALQSPVTGLLHDERGFTVMVGGVAPMQLRCSVLVNAAGLAAQTVARLIPSLPNQTIAPQYLAKGNYFSLSGPQPFTHLVYPVPEQGGLGVHATLDLAGKVRFGPDVEWVATTKDYAVNPARGEQFYAAIRTYWPGLPDHALQPDYSGIRTKIAPPGSDGDFIIQGPATHGLPGLINLYGIESPGLTAALSIAAEVGGVLQK